MHSIAQYNYLEKNGHLQKKCKIFVLNKLNKTKKNVLPVLNHKSVAGI